MKTPWKQIDCSKVLQTLFDKGFPPPHCNTCKCCFSTGHTTEWKAWNFFERRTIFTHRSVTSTSAKFTWTFSGDSARYVQPGTNRTHTRQQPFLYPEDCGVYIFLRACVRKLLELSLPAVLCVRECSPTSVCWHPASLRALPRYGC